MNQRAALSACLNLIAATALATSTTASAAALDVQIAPRFNGGPLVFDGITNSTANGQPISVTRLDFLISEFSLMRADGSWIAPNDGVAYISGRSGRTSFRMRGLPVGQYQGIRFHVGLPPNLNHADPAKYAADHPLNPEVNALHWGWMGGYVFLALEGDWLMPKGNPGGFSYHIATDRCLMTIEMPVALELSSDRSLTLNLNVDRLFSTPNRITISEQANSTHSCTNDSIADKLRENVQGVFELGSVGSATVVESQKGSREQSPQVAARATPFPFSFPSYFPQPALPKDNPLTREGIELGRRLFFEPLLSLNHSQSCASCHEPAHAFSQNLPVSRGAEGTPGTRNAMPLMNLAWKSSFFWDGRANSLRQQVLQPIQNSAEMHETLPGVIRKLRKSAAYPALFEKTFGTSDITSDRIARALEQFLLVQTADDSKFDRVLRGEAKLTPEEQRGFELFHTEYDPRHAQFGADCFHCHGGPLFQSQTFANNGLDAEAKDPGRYEATRLPGDKGKFAVPSLRNVELTGPYMHDGRFQNLEEVIEYYANGVKRSATLDPNLAKHPEGGVPLSADDKRALVAFLKTLTDERLRPQQNFAELKEQTITEKTKGQIQ